MNVHSASTESEVTAPRTGLWVWQCKIGGSALELPWGADYPMRVAIAEAYKKLTGKEPEFIFSGWGGELTEPELAVVENRVPSAEYEAKWHAK